MAITIDYSDTVTPQYVINVPRADMLLVQSTPVEIRQLNLDTFRQTLNDLMDDEVGINFPTNHIHTAPLTVAGVTLARVVAILDPYAIEFEDGAYNVNVVGGNSNISDVTIKNQVGVNTANSAGLIQVTSGSGLSPEQDERLTDLHQFRGLDSDNPLEIEDNEQRVASKTLVVSDDGTTTTVDRTT
jgi:hypothetical protein